MYPLAMSGGYVLTKQRFACARAGGLRPAPTISLDDGLTFPRLN